MSCNYSNVLLWHANECETHRQKNPTRQKNAEQALLWCNLHRLNWLREGATLALSWPKAEWSMKKSLPQLATLKMSCGTNTNTTHAHTKTKLFIETNFRRRARKKKKTKETIEEVRILNEKKKISIKISLARLLGLMITAHLSFRNIYCCRSYFSFFFSVFCFFHSRILFNLMIYANPFCFRAILCAAAYNQRMTILRLHCLLLQNTVNV